MIEKKFNRLVHCFFNEYLTKHRGVSTNTVKSYRDTFALFCKWLAENKNSKELVIDEISVEDVLAFLKMLESDRGNTPKTRNLRLASIKSFYSMCFMKGAVDRRKYDSIEFIPMKKSIKPLIDFFEHEDVEKMLASVDRDAASGARDFVVLNLLYDAGLRASEVAQLQIKNYDPMNETLEIFGKGNKWRKIKIWSRTNQILQDYIYNFRPQAKPLFRDHLIVSHRREALTRFGIHKICSKYLLKANVPKQLVAAKRSAAHSWRHTAAVNMLRMGMSLQEIKVRLGHEQIDTTTKYLNLDLSIKRERINELVRFYESKPVHVAPTESYESKTTAELMKYLKKI